MTSHYVNKSSKLEPRLTGKMRSYNEINEFLTSNPWYDYSEASLERMKRLDSAYNEVSKSVDTILVNGAYGTNATINCSLKILRYEKYKVGTFFASHFLTFNEHLTLNGSHISNKRFTELLNAVISLSVNEEINATSYELLLMSAYIFFQEEGVDVALVEVHSGGRFDAANFSSPQISVITHLPIEEGCNESAIEEKINDIMEITRPQQWCISSEQSKLLLYKMKEWCEKRSVYWMMPIRKFAQLPYIYEQLFGHEASLAERVVHLYIEYIKQRFSSILRGNILYTKHGHQGRPTYEKKIDAKNPPIPLKKFWSDSFSLPRGCFEYLEKEKPTTLLDSSYHGTALDNLFLGVRLLNYQRPIKECALLLACSKSIDMVPLLKRVRYVLKKLPGTLLVFPLQGYTHLMHSEHELYETAQRLLVPVKKMLSFEAAVEEVEFTVDDRSGLMVVFGCKELLSSYWRMKGVKKLQ